MSKIQSIQEGAQILNLYAQWSANADSLTYNANGGTGEMTATEGHVDEVVKISENEFSNGRIYIHRMEYGCRWQRYSYSAGDDYTLTPGDDVLYAQWSRDLSTVTVTPYEGTYDGKGHNVTVKGIINGDKVEYFLLMVKTILITYHL